MNGLGRASLFSCQFKRCVRIFLFSNPLGLSNIISVGEVCAHIDAVSLRQAHGRCVDSRFGRTALFKRWANLGFHFPDARCRRVNG
jgi:hypothetical protein